jgi:hypothetical protein
MASGIPPVGVSQNEPVLRRQCSSRGAVYHYGSYSHLFLILCDMKLFHISLQYYCGIQIPTKLCLRSYIRGQPDLNPLAPNDPYMGRTAQLTSRRCILNTYSTNICTEYFKRAA